MEKRRLGQTDMELSLLGFGGFHLCEIPFSQAEKLLNMYLDNGGNYIETAPSYGNGESEIKIGKAVSHRRDDYYLATKAHKRDYEGCKADIEQSLKNLQTDYLDILFMHAVDSEETLEMVLNGSIKAAEEAKAEGKVRYIGISMHGEPSSLIAALNQYPFDAVMTTINYFDDNNFPDIQNKLMPLAREKGAGIVLMKPLADGYLYQSVEEGFTYALNQDVDVVVTGMNTEAMLKEDFFIANGYEKKSSDDLIHMRREGVELGRYVCRQCGLCEPCPEGVPIQELFLLEGMYDRQMSDGSFRDSADYALKERLKGWFGKAEKARKLYGEMALKADACTECGVCMKKCPYAINIIRKLQNVDYKLSGDYGKILL